MAVTSIQTTVLIISFASSFFGIGVVYGALKSRINNNSEKITMLEEKHETFEDLKTRITRIETLVEFIHTKIIKQ